MARREVVVSTLDLRAWSNARVAWVIFAFALVLRLVFLLDIRDNPFFDSPVIDAEFYRDLGLSLARGEGTGRAPFMMPPLYPLVLSVGYRVFGEGVWWPHLLQALLGAASAALTAVLGFQLGGRWVGVVAGVLIATSRAMLFVEGDLLATPLVVCLDVAFLVLAGRVIQRGCRLLDVLAAGGVAGLAALARPSVLAPLAVLTVLLVLHVRRLDIGRARRIAVPVLFVTAMVLPVVPVTVYNTRTSGERVWISANGGINFYLGNNPDMRRTVALRPGPEYRRINDLPLREAGLVHPADRDRWFYREGLRFWREQPARALAHTFEKAVLLVQNHEIMRDFDLYWFAQHYSRMLRLPHWNFAMLWSLALVGWIWGRPRNTLATLQGVFLLTYAAGIVLFFVTARYRAPLLPGLAVFAVLGTAALAQALGARQMRRAVAMLAVAGAAAIVALVDWYGVDRVDEVEARYRVATAYQSRGDFEQALAGYDHVLRLDPNHALAAARAAQCEQRSGRIQAAVTRYESLVQTHPDYVEPWVNLANIAWGAGHVEDAARYFEAAIEIDPWFAQAYGYYGMFLMSQRDARGAVTHFQKALRLDPAWVALRLDLAHALVLLGDPQAGLRELGRALDVMPRTDRSELIRGDAYWHLDRRSEARAAWQAGLDLNRNNVELQRRLQGATPDAAPRQGEP